MSIRNALFYAAVSIAAVAAPMVGSARAIIDIDVAPPAAVVEEVPPARAGFVWTPGYYNWEGGRHVWMKGHFVKERRGFHWTADRWEQHGNKWHHEAGRWDRD